MQPFLRAAVSLQLAEISIPRVFLLQYTLHDLDFSQVRHRLYRNSLFVRCKNIFGHKTYENILHVVNTLIVSITLQPVGLGLLTTPSPIVPSLHRLKPSFFLMF